LFPKQYGFPGPEAAMARKLWPMALGWWLYGVSGVIALKYLNVPMFSSFRRFTTIIVMFGEYRLYGRVPPTDQAKAVIVMTLGAAIAGLTDLTFSLPGYCWVITCAVSTALYLLFISKLGKESGLNDLGLLFYNNLLALPFMGLSLVLSGELPLVMQYKWLNTLDFQAFFLFSAMQAFFLNFLIFLCTRVNSPLITSITGTIKDLVTNGLGMTLFGDFPFNLPNIVSIAICFMGSVWYSKLKYDASNTNKAPPAADK
jgi:solute carrier family 35 protein